MPNYQRFGFVLAPRRRRHVEVSARLSKADAVVRRALTGHVAQEMQQQMLVAPGFAEHLDAVAVIAEHPRSWAAARSSRSPSIVPTRHRSPHSVRREWSARLVHRG